MPITYMRFYHRNIIKVIEDIFVNKHNKERKLCLLYILIPLFIVSSFIQLIFYIVFVAMFIKLYRQNFIKLITIDCLRNR